MSQRSEIRVHGSGVVLNVREAGKGPAVLLLHGFPDSRRLWNDVSPLLVAAGYRVIAPDLRGYGRSDAPPDVNDCSLGHVVGRLNQIFALVFTKLTAQAIRFHVHNLPSCHSMLINNSLRIRKCPSIIYSEYYRK